MNPRNFSSSEGQQLTNSLFPAAEDERKRAILFAASIISTGLTFHVVHELFLRAHLNMPLREDQFYKYQRKFIEFIGE